MSGPIRMSTTPVAESLIGVDGPVVLQFDATWTELIEPPFAEAGAPPGLRYTTEGDDLGPMQIRHFDYEGAVEAGGGVSVLFSGEQPRLLGIVRPGFADGLEREPDKPEYEILAIRMKAAVKDARKLYYLLQEMEFNPAFEHALDWTDERLSRHFTQAERDAVIRDILGRLSYRSIDPSGSGSLSPESFQQKLQGVLVKRLIARGDAEPPPGFPPLDLGAKELLVGMTNVFRDALPPGGEGEWDAVHNEFSAGCLAVPIGEIPGVDRSIVVGMDQKSGEPDSAAVMLYAEFALAMIEYAEAYPEDPEIVDAGEFWVTLLNSLVQMQAVYFHRYARTFTGCDGDGMLRPKPSTDYAAVVQPIAQLRHRSGRRASAEEELECLRGRMRCHAMYFVQQGALTPF